MELEQLKNAHQITRYCLIGSGIIHGLEVFVDESSYVSITAGAGLSSDGTYLENATKKLFTYYRESQETDAWADYFPFQTWQLFEKHTPAGQSLKPQNSQQALNPFLHEKVVLLYTEPILPTKAIEPEKSSRFTLNQENVFLVADQEEVLKWLDLNTVATNILWSRLRDDEDYIGSDEFFRETPNLIDLNKTVNPALRLEIIPLLRFGFAPGNPFVCPPNGEDPSTFPAVQLLKDIYTGDATKGTSGYEDAVDKAIASLDRELRKLVNLFFPILSQQRGWDTLATIDLLKDKWEAYKKMNSDATKAKKEYVQYFYDWLRDLINGYHELRQLLIELVADTFPNINEHRQHLLLGLAIKGNVINVPSPLRHHFVQPPIYNGNAARLEQVKFYFWRILLMIKGFYLPDYLPSNRLKACNIGADDGLIDLDYSAIKITPSKFYNHPLAEQSIPFYYPVYEHQFSLHRYWSHRHTKSSTEDHLLSYHANDSEDGYTEVPQVIHPLHYNLDAFDFYRIEGHIGRMVFDVKSNEEEIIEHGFESYLKYLIQKYNLDFEVVFVGVEQLTSSSLYPLKIDEDKEQETYNHWTQLAADSNGLTLNLLGMEHLAGVKKGGTLIIVSEQREKIVEGEKKKVSVAIADFSLPYRLSTLKYLSES
jgi:hypothetical protein